ncbi:MAG: manganese catalase family protein [Clostridia bacterium]|nr:manganese catalase family protein [Clostridia bacterium]
MSNDTHKSDCAAPGPYPLVKVLAENPFYANLLLEDYGGLVSEFTAIAQYSYNHFVTDEEEVGELMECVSITEMHHLELLGETIKMLGGDPKYVNSRGKFWNADYVYYGKGAYEILTSAIASEKEAIEQYRRHQQVIVDPHIVNLLERIIKDEIRHIELFIAALRKLRNGNKESKQG